MGLAQAVRSAVDFIHKSIDDTVEDSDGKYTVCDGVNFEKFLYTLGGLNNE